ncbi:MAG: alpha/beta hydrolase family protein [Verrucomicrobiota bacterium]|nr:alpha/beta hydrolase family protein [Verrucomicrobiota bacterium]
MAFIECNFFSDVLGLSTSMNVILPQSTTRQIGMQGKVKKEKYPVLYLLHGLSDDHSIWLRRTSIERYASGLGIAVIMPEVHRSFYTNMSEGPDYWTFISEELPALAQSFFPISDKREDNFAAGLSMGGYGAFKLGLLCPDKFAAVASLSGALDVLEFLNSGESTPEKDIEMKRIFGSVEDFKGSENDLYNLAEKLAHASKPAPKFYQLCGTEDFLYKGNQQFKEYMNKMKLPLKYYESTGTHTWGLWDNYIQKVLDWLPL